MLDFNSIRKVEIKENEILLFCYEKGEAIYANVKSNSCKRIPLAEYENWTFSPSFLWKDNYIILSDYKGNLVRLDINKEHFEIIAPRRTALVKSRKSWKIFL